MDSSTLLNLVAGLFGAAVGALLSWLVSRRHRRIDMVFDMHREFNSIEMIHARYRASDLLSRYPADTYVDLRAKVGRVEMRDVWTVVSFYQRLWLAIRHGAVQKAYVADLFGDIFMWWYDSSFVTQLIPTTNEFADHIVLLRNWMERHSTAEERRRWAEGTTKLYAFSDGGKIRQGQFVAES